MRTGPIPECRVVEGDVLVVVMAIITARVKWTHTVVRKDWGKGRERKMEMVNGTPCSPGMRR
jgi:acetamidase/formamidase